MAREWQDIQVEREGKERKTKREEKKREEKKRDERRGVRRHLYSPVCVSPLCPCIRARKAGKDRQRFMCPKQLAPSFPLPRTLEPLKATDRRTDGQTDSEREMLCVLETLQERTAVHSLITPPPLVSPLLSSTCTTIWRKEKRKNGKFHNNS